MSVLLDAVHTARRQLDKAANLNSQAAAAVRNQESHIRKLEERLEDVRRTLVDRRVAAATGEPLSTSSKLSDSDLISSELDVEAAKAVLDQLKKRENHAAAQIDPSNEAAQIAICDYADELHSQAIKEIEAALGELSLACAKGIAAEVVSREHGELKGQKHSPSISVQLGPCAALTEEIARIRNWPDKIERRGFSRQYVSQKPTDHAGVAEQIQTIKSDIEGAGK